MLDKYSLLRPKVYAYFLKNRVKREIWAFIKKKTGTASRARKLLNYCRHWWGEFVEIVKHLFGRVKHEKY